MGRELEVSICVGGLMVRFGRKRAISIVTSKNDITCPSLSNVNWMLQLASTVYHEV